MPVYKDTSSNLWYCKINYKVGKGEYRQKIKRGFKLKREAESWERAFLSDQTAQQGQEGESVLLFKDIASEYLRDKQATRKAVTYRTSESRVRVWLLPYFGEMDARSITPLDIKQWHEYLRSTQNEHNKPLSKGYIATLHRELSIIFNYGIKYYDLAKNPAALQGNVKQGKTRSLNFWTLDQFNAFIDTFEKDSPFYVAFMVLFWTGCRVGELEALTLKDIDFDAHSIEINKTFHLISGKEVVTSPKTAAGERTVIINESLLDILRAHISRLYEPGPDSRLFTMTPSSYGKQLEKHAALADLPKIRVHDLRHSHASFLINMGASPTLIAARLGHEKVSMTLDIYGHLYPSKQDEIAEKIEQYF